MSRDSGVAGFGANEWMVEEMRDAWRSDPASVGPRWRSLFEAEAAAPAATAAAQSSDARKKGRASCRGRVCTIV